MMNMKLEDYIFLKNDPKYELPINEKNLKLFVNLLILHLKKIKTIGTIKL